MIEEIEKQLEISFDEIVFQLSKGVSIEGLKKGTRWHSFEQVKEWQNRMGYKLHIYSNDHFIDGKPHFHLIKQSEQIDCKFDFFGKLLECAKTSTPKKITDAVKYFCEISGQYDKLIAFWNHKNPKLIVR